MRHFFLLSIFLLMFGLIEAQVITVDKVPFNVGKRMTIYGKITDASFNPLKKNDTTIFKMIDSLATSAITIKINPLERASFGYRPEIVLPNKMIYLTGNIKNVNGLYEIIIESPFDIAFSRPKFQTKEGVTNEETAPAEQTEISKVAQKDKGNNNGSVQKNKNFEGNPNLLSKATARVTDSLVGKEFLLDTKLKAKSGPGNFFTNVALFKKGEKVTVVSCSFEWCKIAQLKPVNGRIAEGYVQVKNLLNK